jgi:hypothetical protein
MILREIKTYNFSLFLAMQCKIVKGKYAHAKIHVTFGTPSPQAGLLTGRRLIPIVPVESLSFFILLSKHFHGGFMICMLQRAVSCGVFNVLVEGSVDLLCPFIDVADPNVEVVKPLSVVTITSS